MHTEFNKTCYENFSLRLVYEFNATTQVPNPIIKSTEIVMIPPITYFNPFSPLLEINCTIPISIETIERTTIISIKVSNSSIINVCLILDLLHTC